MSLEAIAKEVLSMLAAGRYRSAQGLEVDIGELQHAAVANTRLYRPAELDQLRELLLIVLLVPSCLRRSLSMARRKWWPMNCRNSPAVLWLCLILPRLAIQVVAF